MKLEVYLSYSDTDKRKWLSQISKYDKMLLCATYMLRYTGTFRETSQALLIPRSTVHTWMHTPLKEMNPAYHDEVQAVIACNKDNRAIRGGEATKALWAKRQRGADNEQKLKNALKCALKRARAKKIGRYILNEHATIRSTAKFMGLDKSTISYIIRKWLPAADIEMYDAVRKVLKENRYNGGRKYDNNGK